MTTEAEISFSVCPELKLIIIPMGIVANGTVSGTNRAMDMFLIPKFSLVDVALEACFVNPAGEHGDFSVTVPLTMTAHTVYIRGGAMEPFVFTVQLPMTGEACGRIVRIFFETFNIEPGIIRELFAVAGRAFLGDNSCAVEEECFWCFKINVEQGSHRLIANLEFLASWCNNKGVFALFERQSVMDIENSIFFMTKLGVDNLIFTLAVL